MIKRLFMLCLLALAVGMAVPSTRAQIRDHTIVPVRNYIGGRLAPGRLDAMANQLDVRLGRGEGLPGGDFQAWIRRDYTGPETDPWGNPWYVTSGRSNYTVGSSGPDGEQGTDDDITVTRSLEGRRPR
jgi:hypothetical protein